MKNTNFAWFISFIAFIVWFIMILSIQVLSMGQYEVIVNPAIIQVWIGLVLLSIFIQVVSINLKIEKLINNKEIKNK